MREEGESRKFSPQDFFTDAIRPEPHVLFEPEEGYRKDTWGNIPLVAIAARRQKLYPLFEELAGGTINTTYLHMVLETSHEHEDDRHTDLFRDDIESIVLQSHLADPDVADLLSNDGKTGIALIHPEDILELQFDEHKLLVVYHRHEFEGRIEALLRRHGILQRQKMKFVTEVPHIHYSSDRHADRFRQLAMELGVGPDSPPEFESSY